MGYNTVANNTAPKSAKFRENSNLQQVKVMQGHWYWCQSKAHMQVPISHL